MAGSITADGARGEIAENAIAVGNPVKASTKLHNQSSSLLYSDSSSNLATKAVTASKPVYIDSSSVPQTGTIPFALPINQATTTSPMFDLTGNGGAGILTQTLVAAGEVTTFTVTGYVRVLITDDGNQVTDGSYYIAFGTIV